MDKADASRFDYEAEGIFLNYVNYADLRYGGGSVVVNGVAQVITPIHMTDARPTASYNTITYSKDAAMSASPNSSLETNFHSPAYQTVSFTPDYDRVGPDIHGNTLIDNSVNGLFIRVRTPAGNDLQKLTVAGRWDDADIVHVVGENLVIDGTPGGPILESTVPPTVLVSLAALDLTPDPATPLAEGTYNYRITYVNANGNETPASEATSGPASRGRPGRDSADPVAASLGGVCGSPHLSQRQHRRSQRGVHAGGANQRCGRRLPGRRHNRRRRAANDGGVAAGSFERSSGHRSRRGGESGRHAERDEV